jgi:hypothetical protein
MKKALLLTCLTIFLIFLFMISLLASYSETNYNTDKWLHNPTSGKYYGQEFLNVNRSYLDSCKFYLEVLDGDIPTGGLRAYLYARTGAVEEGLPSGSPLAVSDIVAGSSLPSSMGLVTFTFPQGQKILLNENTAYCIVVENVNADGSVYLGVDNSSPSAYGQNCYSTDGISWSTNGISVDVCFYVYGTLFVSGGGNVWEYLPKNQVDNETIEQAIARLIAVHEGASDSHLGVGESLAAHKAADVIDHPAQSVLPDKFDASWFNFFTDFVSLDAFSIYGQASALFPGFSLRLESPDRLAYVKTSEILPNNRGVLYSDFVCNYSSWIVDASVNDKYTIGLRSSYNPYGTWLTYGGVYFIYTGGKLYAEAKSPSQTLTSSEISIDSIENIHAFRIEYISANNAIYFYIDGVLVATLGIPTSFPATVCSFNAQYYAPSTIDDSNLYVSSLDCYFKA